MWSQNDAVWYGTRPGVPKLRTATLPVTFVCLTLFVCSTPAFVCTGTYISYVPPSSAGETHPDGVRTAGQGRGWSRGRGHPEHGQRCAPCRHRCSTAAVSSSENIILLTRPVPPPAVFCVGGPVAIDGACEAPSPLSGPLPTREQRKRKRRVLSLENYRMVHFCSDFFPARRLHVHTRRSVVPMSDFDVPPCFFFFAWLVSKKFCVFFVGWCRFALSAQGCLTFPGWVRR